MSLLFPASTTTVLTEDGTRWAYADLAQRATDLAARAEDPTEGRALVLCVLDNTLGGLLGYLAFAHGPHAALIVSPETAPTRIQEILDSYRPEYCWAPDGHIELGQPDHRAEGYTLRRLRADRGPEPHPELCLLASTSGSTGSATFVRQSRTNVAENTRSIVEYLGLTPSDRAITSLPLHYTFGMSIVNSQIASGGDLVLSDKSIAQREFWRLLREREVGVLAGVPYTFEMLDRMRAFRKDLPHVRAFLQAGGKLSEDLQVRIAAYAEQFGKQLFIMYGQTEATTRMAYLPPARCAEKVGSIGIPIPRGTIRLVSEEGAEITEPGEVGEMVYSGPNVCMGYATKRADLALGDEWEGELATGDLASRDADGYLFIKGRKKRIVKHYGQRISLDEVEQLLKAANPGIGLACVSDGDALVLFADAEIDQALITAQLTASTEIRRDSFRLERCAEIPRLPNGKTDYQALKRMV